MLDEMNKSKNALNLSPPNIPKNTNEQMSDRKKAQCVKTIKNEYSRYIDSEYFIITT
jgi:hypothetical protein